MAGQKWGWAHPQRDRGKMIGAKLTTTLVDKLNALCDEWDMPRNEVMEKLLHDGLAVTASRRDFLLWPTPPPITKAKSPSDGRHA
jgi:hypothetical protein